jgi:hypothetical protein
VGITKVGRKEEKLTEDLGYENLSENICLTMVGESSFYKSSSENIQNKSTFLQMNSDSE